MFMMPKNSQFFNPNLDIFFIILLLYHHVCLLQISINQVLFCFFIMLKLDLYLMGNFKL